MIATSTERSSRLSYFFKFLLMVIITLPGTHLLARDEAPAMRYRTTISHKQLDQAIAEADKRLGYFLNNTKDQTILLLRAQGSLEISIQLLPSSAMNYHLSGFVPGNTHAKPIILINSNWLEYGISDEALVRLILEGTGAAIAGKSGKTISDGNWLANALSSIYKDEPTVPLKADAILLNGIRTAVYFR